MTTIRTFFPQIWALFSNFRKRTGENFESACREKLYWDTVLNNNFRQKWYSFYQILHQLERIQVLLRLFKTCDAECSYDIDGFADAWGGANGDVIYASLVTNHSSSVTFCLFAIALFPSQKIHLGGMERLSWRVMKKVGSNLIRWDMVRMLILLLVSKKEMDLVYQMKLVWLVG